MKKLVLSRAKGQRIPAQFTILWLHNKIPPLILDFRWISQTAGKQAGTQVLQLLTAPKAGY